MKQSPKQDSALYAPFTCPQLSQSPGIRHGFFGRSGGVSAALYESLNCGFGSGDDTTLVAENRSIIADTLGVAPTSLCTAFQIHSAKAVIVDKPWHWSNAPEADALVTSEPGIAIGVLTADCVPVLFADSKHHVIAAAHAGWKGAFNGVIEATLEAMLTLGATLPTITATVGPAIAQGSYEVGAEFYERFVLQDAANGMYFLPSSRNSHFMFDLKAYVKDRLRNAGVAQVNMMAHDTCQQDNDFFSFRRSTLRDEPVYGRQISAISLDV
jgi:YfiH family protein